MFGRKRFVESDAGKVEAVVSGGGGKVVESVKAPLPPPPLPVAPVRVVEAPVPPVPPVYEPERAPEKAPEPGLIGELSDDVPDFDVWLREAVRSLGEDYVFVGPDQVASSPPAVIQAQVVNLLFANYCESRRVRELLEKVEKGDL
jgi:hypothetical protein